MHLETGRPLSGEALERLRAFLTENGLRYDPGIQFTALLMENGEIQAAGSLDGATLKCIAVRPQPSGRGADRAADDRAAAGGLCPGHSPSDALHQAGQRSHVLADIGFYPILRTGDCLLMENLRDGLRRRLLELAQGPTPRGTVGAVVANCNPFTLGHRYLIETAAAACDRLLVFILSENRGPFTPMERLAMARAGCADLSNVRVLPTGPSLILLGHVSRLLHQRPLQSGRGALRGGRSHVRRALRSGAAHHEALRGRGAAGRAHARLQRDIKAGAPRIRNRSDGDSAQNGGRRTHQRVPRASADRRRTVRRPRCAGAGMHAEGPSWKNIRIRGSDAMPSIHRKCQKTPDPVLVLRAPRAHAHLRSGNADFPAVPQPLRPAHRLHRRGRIGQERAHQGHVPGAGADQRRRRRKRPPAAHSGRGRRARFLQAPHLSSGHPL